MAKETLKENFKEKHQADKISYQVMMKRLEIKKRTEGETQRAEDL